MTKSQSHKEYHFLYIYIYIYVKEIMDISVLQSVKFEFKSRNPGFKEQHTPSAHYFTFRLWLTFICVSNQPCNLSVRAALSGRKCFLMKSFINFNTTCQLTWCIEWELIHISDGLLLRKQPYSALKWFGCSASSTPMMIFLNYFWSTRFCHQ